MSHLVAIYDVCGIRKILPWIETTHNSSAQIFLTGNNFEFFGVGRCHTDYALNIIQDKIPYDWQHFCIYHVPPSPKFAINFSINVNCNLNCCVNSSRWDRMTHICTNKLHDDVIKWKHFSRYWVFCEEIYQSPVDSYRKGQWHGTLMFSLICAWTKAWASNRDLTRHRAHYDANVMTPALVEIMVCDLFAAKSLYEPMSSHC